jgi:hypothetical protein
MTTMINFFKKHGVLMLVLLMFPVLWPVYLVYELVRSSRVTYHDCQEAWNLWIFGTVTYCVICAALLVVYQVALTMHAAGYLIPLLKSLAAILLLVFVHISAPKVIYYIFKKKKKSNE